MNVVVAPLLRFGKVLPLGGTRCFVFIPCLHKSQELCTGQRPALRQDCCIVRLELLVFVEFAVKVAEKHVLGRRNPVAAY